MKPYTWGFIDATKEMDAICSNWIRSKTDAYCKKSHNWFSTRKVVEIAETEDNKRQKTLFKLMNHESTNRPSSFPSNSGSWICVIAKVP
jgi:hypothetical protein